MKDREKLSPPPNQFSHQLSQDEFYYLSDPQNGKPPDGMFNADTKVLLYRKSQNDYCYVISADGIMARIAYHSLKPITLRTKDQEKARTEAFQELDEALTRPYYDVETDLIEKERYYQNIDLSSSVSGDDLYDALSELLSITHINKLAYKPTKQLYPWVDLYPDHKLRSIYTGDSYEPKTLIEESLALEAEFEALRRAFMANEFIFDSPEFTEALLNLVAGPDYDCEHVVPQNWFKKEISIPKGDLHHLFTCKKQCNSYRGNVPFWDFSADEQATLRGCGRKDGNKFEPTFGKGMAARATLYFLIRYPTIIDDIAKELQAERIPVLISWHQNEPVTIYEKHRNSAIFYKQGNRNPLIDLPELANRINFTRGLGQ